MSLLIGSVPLALAQPDGAVVVLSSESGPYQEALAGFRETFTSPTATYVLSKEDLKIPESTRLIIAIGGKAAMYPYEGVDVPLIYCVAPGAYVDPERYPGPIQKVFVSPPPGLLLDKIRELQPAIRRLGVVWVNASAAHYGESLKSEGARRGLAVRTGRLVSLADLPDWLRAMKGKVDALWIPPDPLLITPESFATMRQYALDNNIPLYVSMDGMAEKGASAAVSVSYHEMGKMAGTLASRALLSASVASASIYVDKVTVTINSAAAARSGLSIATAVLRRADRVIP